MEVRASATGFLAGVIMWSLKREMCFLRRDGECELCKLIALFVAAAGITVLCVCVCVCVSLFPSTVFWIKSLSEFNLTVIEYLLDGVSFSK